MSSTWEKVVVRDRIWSRGLVYSCWIHVVIKKIDKGLLSALLERWHRDKITFHLFVGEMRITLDDMASLLAFFTIVNIWVRKRQFLCLLIYLELNIRMPLMRQKKQEAKVFFKLVVGCVWGEVSEREIGWSNKSLIDSSSWLHLIF